MDGKTWIGAVETATIEAMDTLRYVWIPDELAVCRLPKDSPVPDWLPTEGFTCVTRTDDELSIVCESREVPPGIKSERGWRALKVLGPLPFDAVGILRRFVAPLADAGIPIIGIGTFDTDYVMVRADQIDSANVALAKAGLVAVSNEAN
ncbi:MAG: ACT domain-containing protein [Synoicihabitans sp.]